MALNKNIKRPQADYHQWQSSEISNGDIIGVYESLPNRAAHSVTLESAGGNSIVRLNVTQKIFANQEKLNPWMQDASFWRSPIMLDEVEISKDNIVIESGTSQYWTNEEIGIIDIKVITSSGLRITVT